MPPAPTQTAPDPDAPSNKNRRVTLSGGSRRSLRIPPVLGQGTEDTLRARSSRPASEQVTERFLGLHRRDGRARVVPDVPRDNMPRAAGTRGRHLQRVLEVCHREVRSVPDGLGTSSGHRDEACQFDDKITGVPSAAHRSDEVIEVRHRGPSDAGALGTVLNLVQEFCCRAGGWAAVKGKNALLMASRSFAKPPLKSFFA